MKIQILGSGCKKCNDLYANAQAAVQQNQLDCEIEKVSDIEKIVSMGVMVTPALAIDGKVVSSGSALSADEIARLVMPEKKESCCCCSGESADAEPSSCCGGSAEPSVPCCCAGTKNKFFKKVFAALLLVFVFGSVLYMVDRENKPAGQTSAENIPADTLKVYYFHGNKRCYTCNKIEELTREAVGNAEKVRFISVNVEDKENEHFINDFQLVSRCVVMERNGTFEKFEKVWELVKTPEAFTSYIKDGVERLTK